MKIITKSILLSALLAVFSLNAGTDDHGHDHHGHHHVDSAALFKGSLGGVYGREADKLVQLAKEFSEEQLAWAPAEGVFTGQGVLEHLISANYFLGSMLGLELPEGLNPREIGESLEGKEETIKTLEESIAFVKKALNGLDAHDLATEIDFFGNKMPKMSVALIVSGHSMEHLGQMIAYARSNGIVPPWSRPQPNQEG
ncbi:MAG: DinB family protein [Opitutales bacterium]|nr:DinB family protein [Opitutales bacterium]